ncbi:MAG: hypothetical protein QM791_00250 [Ferruginibacter sp.]
MLFRKKKEKSTDQPLKEKAAKGIARFLLSIQSKFADAMNAGTKHIPSKKMKMLLVAFCLFSGGFSIYLVANAILKPDEKQPAFKVDQMNVPKYYDRSGDEYFQADQYVDKETYQSIGSFEQYMDSLQRSETGKKIHDSILIARPGLMDSIKMLKEIYHSQLK